MPYRLLLMLVAAVALASCGEGEGAAPAASGVPAAPVTFAPAGEARPVAPPPGLPVPDGAVYVPSGTTTVGVRPGEGGLDQERPAFDAAVEAFFLDRSLVSVARFRAFVDATGYTTQAEAFGDGTVMDQRTGQWALVPGADWRRPRGATGAVAPDDHPVTQVSWHDAAAFCAWDGGRLPTEVEWEHAARGGVNDRSPYAWGDRLVEGARYAANTWTGTFPGGDDGADGYRDGPSPVGAFGATPLGLEDMGGNVWEWTDAWFRPYPLSAEGAGPPPVGPTGEPERVQRGGSFLCNPSYCHGYRVSARSHATAESSFAHVGFRCARDVPVRDLPVRDLPVRDLPDDGTVSGGT